MYKHANGSCLLRFYSYFWSSSGHKHQEKRIWMC